ncbi:hypothetical protein [Bradyrhizobium pachyrhizi]|uniref:hypothetical protein n=1 Tax=Bradyrhizobium pachyrhizi TaxID=280333 RepID=UPI00067DEEFA|nr:hypothetical protein [Bradyrhizobium pachyrhizi]
MSDLFCYQVIWRYLEFHLSNPDDIEEIYGRSVEPAGEASGMLSALGLHIFGRDGFDDLRNRRWSFIAIVGPLIGLVADVATVLAPIASIGLIVFGASFLALAAIIAVCPQCGRRCAFPCIASLILTVCLGLTVGIQKLAAAETKGFVATEIPSITTIQNELQGIAARLGSINTTVATIDDTTKRMESALAIPRMPQAEIPRVSLATTYYSKENEAAIDVLNKYDGRVVFIDIVNQDLSVKQNWEVSEKCRGEDGEYPIPTTKDKAQRDCTYYLSLDIKSDGGVPYSSGGTGVMNLLIRRYFLVNRHASGYKVTFLLREVRQ